MNKQHIIEVAQWMRNNCIVIDTETTGLSENDTIVELAAVNAGSRIVLIDTLVKPSSPMNAGAEKTHGISMMNAYENGWTAHHTIIQLYEISIASLEPCHIASFNWQFDTRMILQTAFKSNYIMAHPAAIKLTQPADGTTCIMELANRYLHEHLEWDAEHSKFKRLSLEKCLQITGIQRHGTAHRALSDALAAADLLNFIAEGW